MDTLTATTTREVVFAVTNPDLRRTDTTRLPAGTEVYCTERRDGTFQVRVPGTLLTQTVRVSALAVV